MQETQQAPEKSSGLLNQKNPPAKRRVGDGTPGPGRPKGMGNKLTENIRQAIEIAARDCHPKGLAGWLVDRANGGIQDRQIFAGMVGRVVPLQVNQDVSGGVSISLNWLGSRNIGTIAAQPRVVDAQTIDLIEHSDERRWITDANSGDAAAQGLQDAQSARTSADTERSALGAPAASERPSRAFGRQADPPPPVDPDTTPGA